MVTILNRVKRLEKMRNKRGQDGVNIGLFFAWFNGDREDPLPNITFASKGLADLRDALFRSLDETQT